MYSTTCRTQWSHSMPAGSVTWVVCGAVNAAVWTRRPSARSGSAGLATIGNDPQASLPTAVTLGSLSSEAWSAASETK